MDIPTPTETPIINPPIPNPIIPSSPSLNPPNNSIVILNIPISTKLTRTNYLSWKSQIEPILHGHNLHRFLSAPPLSPTITIGSQTFQNPDYQQDQLLLGWIRSSLFDTLLSQVLSCSSSAALWENLRHSFSSTSRARLSELRRFLQTTVKGGSSCRDFLSKIQSIADELASIGFPVPDDDLILNILGGLGPEFNSFVAAATTKEDLTLLGLHSMLLSHENLLQSQHSSAATPSAFAVQQTRPTSKSTYQPPQNPFNPRPSGPSNSRPRYPRPNTPKFNQYGPRPAPQIQAQAPLLPNPTTPFQFPGAPIRQRTLFTPNQAAISPNPSAETCQICLKRGHNASICWYRFDEQYGPTASPQAFVAQPFSSSTPTEWFLDSGASHHVTSNLNNLSSYIPYTGLDSLQIGNGTGMKIHHIGSSSFQFDTCTIYLHDILHVPSFTKNLLSLSKLLLDNSLTLEFSSNVCFIKDSHTKTLLL